MQKVCQIPEAILKNMSTDDLIETCLSYPLYGDIFAFDEFQVGFESVTSGFNGLQELLRRKDAGVKLIEKYRQMDPCAIDESWSLDDKGEYAAKYYSIEILLAQNDIVINLSKEQEKLLILECIKKAQTKSKYPEIYGILSFGNIALVTGRIMLKDNFLPFTKEVLTDEKLRAFLKDAYAPNANLVNKILDYAKQYLSEN
jgi:hypothetical protein